jgi:hypothetical protein
VSETTTDLDALRREIAEALGWRFVDGPSDNIRTRHMIQVIAPDGRVITNPYDNYPAKWWSKREYVKALPDWPRDAAAALALCLEIARKRGLHLMFVTSPPIDEENLNIVMFVRDDLRVLGTRMHTIIKPMITSDGATIAEALSRLFLEATKAAAAHD